MKQTRNRNFNPKIILSNVFIFIYTLYFTLYFFYNINPLTSETSTSTMDFNIPRRTHTHTHITKICLIFCLLKQASSVLTQSVSQSAARKMYSVVQKRVYTYHTHLTLLHGIFVVSHRHQNKKICIKSNKYKIDYNKSKT